MDGAGGMRNVNCNIADLTEAISAFIHPKQLRDAGSSLCTQPSRRNMLRKGERSICCISGRDGINVLTGDDRTCFTSC